MKVRLNCGVLFAFFAFCLSVLPARAQLAGLFSNVTKIETRRLGNAVQIVISTDGTVQFGTDTSDWLDTSPGKYETKLTTHFRLRILNARAQVPAFVEIGAYPVDAVLVSPGRELITTPFFPYTYTQSPQADPHVDIELRFAVPISLRRFDVGNGQAIAFTQSLNAREVSVERGADQRSIVITVVPDRNDLNGAAKLRRFPTEQQKHALRVERSGSVNGAPRVSVFALHTPLTEVVSAVARESGALFSVSTDAADADVSLSLPVVTVPEFGRTLETAFGLVVRRDENGWAISRGAGQGFERIAMRSLSPESARVLFPDFLLPSLRADNLGGALWIAASPRVVERVKRDLQIFDVPRKQVRVAAQLWEVTGNDEARRAINVAISGANGIYTLGAPANSTTVDLRPNTQRGVRATLELLQRSGQTRLVAEPFTTVLSGARGTLSLGQTRYVPVARNDPGGTSVFALRLDIGYTLEVTPLAGALGDITLDLRARASTIDALEPGTSLPTLGIREAQGAVRIKSGDTVLLAGLDSDVNGHSRDRFLPARHAVSERRTLLILVSATLV